ncbi:FAD binding domain-containing protein [Bisporella sp. PMI_857]|nr:FAD binding domain-containing protein [Bisporella sp. PMI_857]
MIKFLLAAAALAVSPVLATTCSEVAATTDIKLDVQFSVDYNRHQTEYWSTSCGDLRPSCIIEPTTSEEVAAIVQILRTNNETFAVKSGGHNPNNYFASVSGGPLISTKQLNEIILDRTTETARVGPGNRWDDVSGALDGTGYSAVGGRMGNVGVGGYLLGGGLSFMSTEYGWAANSVLEYTLVLANASIITVSETQHPDIFLSLKGGGNNYGIVTSFLLKVYPQGQVWGGNLKWTASDEVTAKILAALRDFTDNYPDEKAGIILTAERTLATLVDLWILFLYYNGPTPPPGVFDSFTSIGTPINSLKTQSMHELLSGNNWAVLKGSVYTIGTESTTVPSPEHGAEVLGAFYDHWVNVSNTAALVPGTIASVAFQPLPKTLPRIARAKGGDLLDIDDDVNRIILELDYSFLHNSDYPIIDTTMQTTYNGFGQLVSNFQEQGKLPTADLPLFANDCFYPQDYFGRLKPAKAALAKSVSEDLDPDGLWRFRTGGWKP